MTTKMTTWSWRWPLTSSRTSLTMNPRRGELRVVRAKAGQLTLSEIEWLWMHKCTRIILLNVPLIDQISFGVDIA